MFTEESPLLRSPSAVSPKDETTLPQDKKPGKESRQENLILILACVWGGTFLAALGNVPKTQRVHERFIKDDERRLIVLANRQHVSLNSCRADLVIVQVAIVAFMAWFDVFHSQCSGAASQWTNDRALRSSRRIGSSGHILCRG